jgi:pimeloyl-ACP methyl ester carboxylesterase
MASFRDGVLAQGYAVALSTYSESGFAVEVGVKQTHRMHTLFKKQVGTPKRIYLAGHSMGGLIALKLAQKHHGVYDGALPLCGMVGGSEKEIRFITDFRALWDYFYPGTVPGDASYVPPGLSFEQHVVPAVIGSIMQNPYPALEMAGVDQLKLPYTSINELVNTMVTIMYFAIVGSPDIIARAGGVPVDTTQTVYSGSSDDAALNAGIDRFAASEEAQDYIKQNYAPKKQLKIPTVTLHTVLDPVMPFSHEATLHATLQPKYHDNLVQRSVMRYGHCAFQPAEILAAFSELTTWVESK